MSELLWWVGVWALRVAIAGQLFLLAQLIGGSEWEYEIPKKV